MEKRVIRDEFDEVINDCTINYSTNEFVTDEVPSRIDANCNVGEDGYISGNIQIEDRKINLSMNNVSAEDAIIVITQMTIKFKEISDKYIQ